MTALADVIERISETQEALRRLGNSLRSYPDKSSLRMAYQSLQRHHEDLEQQFLLLADQAELDVCSYRMLPERGQLCSALSLGKALADFQRWFTTVYDAVKHGPKRRARASADAIAESTLNFAFSYPGSLGVVLTIPSERLLFENQLQQTASRIAQMLDAERSEDMARLAGDMGIPAVRALYAWIASHVEGEMGAEIRWFRDAKPVSNREVGTTRLGSLKRLIEATSEKEESTFETRGWLVGADTSRHSFHMAFPEAEEMRGRMSEEVGTLYTVEIPGFYCATIVRTVSVSYSTAEEKVDYYLRSLRKEKPEPSQQTAP